jgi:alpha-beta hydrolase superfamily lysophospholipase
MKKKNLKKMILWTLGIYVFIILAIYAMQKYIIFQPEKLKREYQFQFENPFEEFFIKTPDEKTLNALLFKTQKTRKGLVLYFHGNADNLQRWGKYQVDFTSRGYDILLMDFRGYGKSTGKPSEQKFYEDAKLMYEWVLKKYSKDEIIIYGRSLGCAMASYLATKVDVRKVFLETPFYSANQLLKDRGELFIFPFDFKYDFPNYKHLQKINEPVIIFAGTKDWVVPNSSTEQLRPFLKSSDQFIYIEGAGHKNLNAFEKYHTELDSLLE